MTDYKEVFLLYENNRDDECAKKMSAYMRNQFDYLGLPTPNRRELSKVFIKNIKAQASIDKKIDWNFIYTCFDKNEREYQYLALDYLNALYKYLNINDLPHLRNIALKKSWWDTIDSIDEKVGFIISKNPTQKQLMLEWSKDDNFWIRRMAIDHQLGFKQNTDLQLLEEIIKNNFGQKEFFITKAIGWALREYAKTDPKWVVDFVKKYEDNLDKLSIREALKNIK